MSTLEKIRAEMERLHYHPKLDFIKNDEVVDMALEIIDKYAEAQEPCDDAISRQAVLEKAVHTETEEGWCGYTVDVDYIKSLPSVRPQEQTDEWCINCRHSIKENEVIRVKCGEYPCNACDKKFSKYEPVVSKCEEVRACEK